jgi:FkbM family methyltransferase
MGSLERMVIDQFVRPGMHVLDVGANIGLYALYFSRRVGETGKVTSMEPVPELQEALTRTMEKNKIINVEILPYAAGATDGFSRLSLDPLNSGNNWIGAGDEEGQVQISVPARRADGLGLQPVPDFIKIDVQGWEVQALQGMSGFFENGERPVLFCEVSETSLRLAAASSEMLGRSLVDLGYDIYLPLRRGAHLELKPLTLASLGELALRNLYFDVIALDRNSPEISRIKGNFA